MYKQKNIARNFDFAKKTNGILLNNDKKIIIDWSAKSGCTNIVTMFFKYIDLYKNFHLENPIDIHNERIKYRLLNKIEDSFLINTDYLKIKFVRNPYSRAVSSYLHLRINNLSFYEFLLKLFNNNYEYNIHYASQHHLLEKKHKIYNEIIKIENIDSEIERINNKYNIKLEYNSLSNHHTQKKMHEKKYVGYIKYSNIKDIPSYRYFYDDERIKQLVYDIYKIDINLYNYTFEEFLKLN